MGTFVWILFVLPGTLVCMCYYGVSSWTQPTNAATLTHLCHLSLSSGETDSISVLSKIVEQIQSAFNPGKTRQSTKRERKQRRRRPPPTTHAGRRRTAAARTSGRVPAAARGNVSFCVLFFLIPKDVVCRCLSMFVDVCRCLLDVCRCLSIFEGFLSIFEGFLSIFY